MRSPEERSVNSAAQEMLNKAVEEQQELSWDRWEEQQPQCGFGELGICCKVCNMGPCRIDPFGDGPSQGVCGATADTIAARNLLRMVAAGAAAHSDHGRDVAHALLEAGSDPDSDYRISDPLKLQLLAEEFDIETDGREITDIAADLAECALEEFGKAEGEQAMALRAPDERIETWREEDVMPRAIDREIVQSMHQTHMGVDADYENLMRHAIRTSLGDGWGGSMLATDLQDILFRTPDALKSETNLGVIDPDCVNLIVHGHEPVLSEMVVEAAEEPELVEAAEEAGADGIKLSGICCTANELLMRHGIPSAGSFLHQELAMMTAAADAMVVDVQCIMPGLADVAENYHTNLVTTSYKAKMPGVKHIEFEEARALEVARDIVAEAIDGYKNRPDEGGVFVPDEDAPLIAGFTTEYVNTLLGGKFRPSYRPLNNAIIEGRIRGVAGVVGCENTAIQQGYNHNEMVKELLRHDVLVISTGCSAIACAREGLLQPEAAYEYAGDGLREVCEAVGMPPVLHFGSCVDNSRILTACVEVLKEGGLGDDISDLPVAGAAPEWMSEKAISIGMYFVASGVYTVICDALPVQGAPGLEEFLTEGMEEMVGATWAWEEDPVAGAHLMLDRINQKREELNLRDMMNEPVEIAASAAGS